MTKIPSVATATMRVRGAIPAEAVLVHDISPPHPRYTQFTQMAADVARRTRGMLTIAINPGGKVQFPGQASLDEVRSQRVPLTFVNSAFLQSIDADLGFLNLPFTITDELMARPRVAEGILDLVRFYVEPHGLRVLGMMRGADTIFVFRNRQLHAPDELKGLRIRVAGPGVYQEIVRSLGAEPVVFPAVEMRAALARGAMEGIITSPGGWGKNLREAPSGSLVPGLIFYTYFLIADREWFDALPSPYQSALTEAARATVTDKWGEMREDDAKLIAEFVAGGATHSVVPADAVAAWRARTECVTQRFTQAHPEAIRQLRAIVGEPG